MSKAYSSKARCMGHIVTLSLSTRWGVKRGHQLKGHMHGPDHYSVRYQVGTVVKRGQLLQGLTHRPDCHSVPGGQSSEGHSSKARHMGRIVTQYQVGRLARPIAPTPDAWARLSLSTRWVVKRGLQLQGQTNGPDCHSVTGGYQVVKRGQQLQSQTHEPSRIVTQYQIGRRARR